MSRPNRNCSIGSPNATQPLPSPKLSTRASNMPALLPCECLQRGLCVRRLVLPLIAPVGSLDPRRCLLGPRFLHSESIQQTQNDQPPPTNKNTLTHTHTLAHTRSRQQATSHHRRIAAALHAQPPQSTRPAPAFGGTHLPPCRRRAGHCWWGTEPASVGEAVHGRPTCAPETKRRRRRQRRRRRRGAERWACPPRPPEPLRFPVRTHRSRMRRK